MTQVTSPLGKPEEDLPKGYTEVKQQSNVNIKGRSLMLDPLYSEDEFRALLKSRGWMHRAVVEPLICGISRKAPDGHMHAYSHGLISCLSTRGSHRIRYSFSYGKFDDIQGSVKFERRREGKRVRISGCEVVDSDEEPLTRVKIERIVEDYPEFLSCSAFFDRIKDTVRVGNGKYYAYIHRPESFERPDRPDLEVRYERSLSFSSERDFFKRQETVNLYRFKCGIAMQYLITREDGSAMDCDGAVFQDVIGPHWEARHWIHEHVHSGPLQNEL